MIIMGLPLYIITCWNLVLLRFQFQERYENRVGGFDSMAYEYQS